MVDCLCLLLGEILILLIKSSIQSESQELYQDVAIHGLAQFQSSISHGGGVLLAQLPRGLPDTF